VRHAIALAEALSNGTTAPANLCVLVRFASPAASNPQHTILESQTRSAACMKEAQGML
jgi:hypothetical protein